MEVGLWRTGREGGPHRLEESGREVLDRISYVFSCRVSRNESLEPLGFKL